jgi:formate hydrogenlyase subunit 6/NADH:ubiquinone oxidoreductase subunit I
MPLWFVRGLRRGVVTTHYPARPDPSASFLPTPPAFRPLCLDRQVADRLCEVCPSHALRIEEADSEEGMERRAGAGLLIFDAGACTACGRCLEAAPEAVTVSGEFELAATSRDSLVKRIPLLRRAGT